MWDKIIICVSILRWSFGYCYNDNDDIMMSKETVLVVVGIFVVIGLVSTCIRIWARPKSMEDLLRYTIGNDRWHAWAHPKRPCTLPWFSDGRRFGCFDSLKWTNFKLIYTSEESSRARGCCIRMLAEFEKLSIDTVNVFDTRCSERFWHFSGKGYSPRMPCMAGCLDQTLPLDRCIPLLQQRFQSLTFLLWWKVSFSRVLVHSPPASGVNLVVCSGTMHRSLTMPPVLSKLSALMNSCCALNKEASTTAICL